MVFASDARCGSPIWIVFLSKKEDVGGKKNVYGSGSIRVTLNEVESDHDTDLLQLERFFYASEIL